MRLFGQPDQVPLLKVAGTVAPLPRSPLEYVEDDVRKPTMLPGIQVDILSSRFAKDSRFGLASGG